MLIHPTVERLRALGLAAMAAGQSSELTREDIIEEVCVPSGNMAF